MALVRRLVELGRAARAESGCKTRQPLRRALVVGAGLGRRCRADLRAEIADELNVGVGRAGSAGRRSLVDVTVKANFRALGKRFGKQVQAVAAAIAAADAAALAAALRARGTATVDGRRRAGRRSARTT